MLTNEHLAGEWREWRHNHIAVLTRPYGWTALTAQHWLREGETDVTLESLPGTWGVQNGKILFTPHGSETLSVNGRYATETVEIPPGRNQTYGHFGSVPVYDGASEVETLLRTTNSGETIYGVRVRDPHTARSAAELGITAFDYDPAWKLPASFTLNERVDVEQPTVEQGVRESTSRIGTLSFEYEGAEYTLAIIGKPTANGTQPVAHIKDLTSGPVTYGAGRVVELKFTDDNEQVITEIDFNYAVALPCAVTNFVTCPIPPAENHLDFAVTAGEKAPNVTVDRVQTFIA